MATCIKCNNSCKECKLYHVNNLTAHTNEETIKYYLELIGAHSKLVFALKILKHCARVNSVQQTS